MYFSMMPQLLINLYNDNTSFKLVTDITTRASSSSEIRNNLFLYDYYDLQDGETPEIVADKVYNDPMLHWVILLCNDIIDPVYDWLLPHELLEEHIKLTYGEDHMFDIHHYENENGDWTSFDYPNASAITNYQYEEVENEKKRRIKLLQTRYLNAFVDEVQQKLSKQVL